MRLLKLSSKKVLRSLVPHVWKRSDISCVNVEWEGEEGGREGRRESFTARTRENSSRECRLLIGSPDVWGERW